MPQLAAEAAVDLAGSLRKHRGEIESAIRARIEADDAPTEAPDPEYGAGLREAVPTALDYCLASIERAALNPPPFPLALLVQARLAARNQVPLKTVLRRYFAGYTILADFVIEQAEEAGSLRGQDLKRLLRCLAQSFDRLIEAVAAEHAKELESVRSKGTHQRRAEQVKRLLAGEPIDAPELAYDLEGHHLGALAKGDGASDALRELAKPLDRRLLLVPREEETTWAWLGGRSHIDSERLAQSLTAWPKHIRLALGEPGVGPHGWRLSHRQAKAALPIALRGPESLVRYANVALLAAVLKDDLLAASLRQMYLEPLERERDGGEVLRETLRAYFAAERNVSSTAATLGISRQAVNSRLRTVERVLDRPFAACAAELEIAHRIEVSPSPSIVSLDIRKAIPDFDLSH